MKLLLIEDNAEHAHLVRRALRKTADPIDIIHVDTLTAGLELLRSGEPFDIMLVDMSLPDGLGPENVARIEAVRVDVPIVVLTSLDDEQTALAALSDGAQDYLIKDQITMNSLMRALCHAIQRHAVTVEKQRLVKELKEAHQLLRRKNKRLRKFYKTAQQFVDNVSHEFRTPLTVIKEYGSLIRDGIVGPVNEEQDRMLNVIEDRADDLNTMVDDMLDVSKLQAGVMGIWRKNCQMTDIVDHIRPALERKAAVKDVKLAVRVEDELPAVYCDAEKIGRVITNLAVNAIKFCGDPGVVELTARADQSRREVVVSVADNGMGISDDGLKTIFARFKQLGVSTNETCKGFGLGLNIAKELVDLNFGSMDIRSEVSAGSTFSFSVPFAIPQEVVGRYVESLSKRRHTPTVAVLTAEVAADVDEPLAADVDSFLNYALRSDDLLFRTAARSWLLVAAVPQLEIGQFTDRLDKAWEDANRNRPYDLLPKVVLQGIGCWPLKAECEQIVSAVESVLQGCEPQVESELTQATVLS